MKFTKMQGLGNDYLYVYGEPQNPEELSIRLSERHFGAGSDGMIWISPSEIADFKMRIFNADGSEAKMCGNGIRCVGKYVYDKGYTDRTELTIETLSGIRTLKLEVKDGAVASVTVDMGQAVTEEEMELSLNVGLDAGAEANHLHAGLHGKSPRGDLRGGRGGGAVREAGAGGGEASGVSRRRQRGVCAGAGRK